MNGALYLASWKRRDCANIKPEELYDLELLQLENRGPEIQKSWAIVDPQAVYYLKAPNLCDFASSDLESHLKKEIEICEILRKHPHHNIATYYGCRANNGRASGLYFKRYEATLLEIVNPQRLNKRAFISSGRSLVNNSLERELDILAQGLDHLHSLGLVHNDITPANIMREKDTGTLVLVDFGSCRRIGESLRATLARRTHEWHDPGVDISGAENDTRAFTELRTWLRGSVEELQW